MKQHFVPRCYLRGFSNSEDFLFTVNLKYIKNGIEKPSLKHINDICFLKDHYNVLKEYDSSTFRVSQFDELFVERDILVAIENKYQEIIDGTEIVYNFITITLKFYFFLKDGTLRIKSATQRKLNIVAL